MKDKKQVFGETARMLVELKLSVVSKDDSRPWGGFFVIDESEAAKFTHHFFPNEKLETLRITSKLSPKILIVAPHQRLSWQYHHRRAEIWKCIGGPVEVITSDTDKEKTKQTLQAGDIIKLKKGERHRLIGLDEWGLVAEIWQHTDDSNPSDEDDIVRLQDDYSRT